LGGTASQLATPGLFLRSPLGQLRFIGRLFLLIASLGTSLQFRFHRPDLLQPRLPPREFIGHFQARERLGVTRLGLL
jgi:hypothetical protein